VSKEDSNEKMNELFEYKAKYGQQFPEISSSFQGLVESVMADGAIMAKQKELIAIGIAVSIRSVPCIWKHVQNALGMGATKEEILEASSVAILMSGGPGMAHVMEVMKAIEVFEV